MLKKVVEGKPDDWDKLLPSVLFAYREVPNTSTGYAPFKLMFGRKVRGSTDVLAGSIAGADNRSEEYIFVQDYVRQLQEDIKTACEIASKNAEQISLASVQRFKLNSTLSQMELMYLFCLKK
ncbi:integrase core domain [Plakobranchus ocellatus]|uniref:Integrase core domain n=1 Tax=Plakobranchus ocellatus TaxID=259542 RepID=A0AAV4AXW2_9GAST|nr:integrase core domain [Plakobranchus ocellatus]